MKYEWQSRQEIDDLWLAYVSNGGSFLLPDLIIFLEGGTSWPSIEVAILEATLHDLQAGDT